ncbi:histidinol phosphate phosphatase domain-containing protein [Desulfurobacterium sp.]
MIDLHTHTVFSDGELIPSELVRRAEFLGYRAIAITDHADYSNYQFIIENLLKAVDVLTANTEVVVLPGVEITHVPPVKIPELIEKCRSEGAKVVVVHGETVVEPVAEGTNLAAIEGGADILAHPGFIDFKLLEMAAGRGVAIEITARKGHNITNGYVVKAGREAGVDFVINTDAHAPSDLIDKAFAYKVGLGAGLTAAEVERAFSVSEEIVRRKLGDEKTAL